MPNSRLADFSNILRNYGMPSSEKLPADPSGKVSVDSAREKPPTTPPRVSFGIELEFLVAAVPDNADDPDKAIRDRLPPPIRVPAEHFDDPGDHIFYNHVRKSMTTTLETAGLLVSRSGYSGWNITSDSTVHERSFGGYRFVSVEISSPASYVRKESFDMIKLVVSVLTTNYRCRVNPSTGFHVHVGNGQTLLQPRNVRRTAALLWAVDPFLSRLHAPDRAALLFSASGRANANTYLGEGTEPVLDYYSSLRGKLRARYFGRDRQLGEPLERDQLEAQRKFDSQSGDGEDDQGEERPPSPCPSDQSYSSQGSPFNHPHNRHFHTATVTRPDIPCYSDEFGFPAVNYVRPAGQPSQADMATSTQPFAIPRPRPPPRARLYPRVPGTIRPMFNKDQGFQERVDYFELADRGGQRPACGDVYSGVAKLLSEDLTAGKIGDLMTAISGAKYSNLNFERYKTSTYAGGGSSPPCPTIEFREAGGTLDPDWICTWTSICALLVEWARDAAPAEFHRVLNLICWAQEEGGDYDVVDFLVDIGLHAEAHVCEKRLKRSWEAWFEVMLVQGDGEADEDWLRAYSDDDLEDVEWGPAWGGKDDEETWKTKEREHVEDASFW